MIVNVMQKQNSCVCVRILNIRIIDKKKLVQKNWCKKKNITADPQVCRHCVLLSSASFYIVNVELIKGPVNGNSIINKKVC